MIHNKLGGLVYFLNVNNNSLKTKVLNFLVYLGKPL